MRIEWRDGGDNDPSLCVLFGIILIFGTMLVFSIVVVEKGKE